jgi:hypothetical protein
MYRYTNRYKKLFKPGIIPVDVVGGVVNPAVVDSFVAVVVVVGSTVVVLITQFPIASLNTKSFSHLYVIIIISSFGHHTKN